MTCRVNGRNVRSIDDQRDLVVQVHISLKWMTQVEKIVKEVCGMIAFIGQGLESWDIILFLNNVFVRLQWFWLVHHRKDVVAGERVQKSFPGMFTGMEDCNSKK